MAGDTRFDYRPAGLAYVLAWVSFSWPWLSGSVTIPYDAKAHFHAQIQFLANAIHSGQWPFWAPHVFAGSPQIADPQSLIFSPALLLALLSPAPTFWMLDTYALASAGIGGGAILLLFRDRGWHPAGAVVAALVLAFGASAAWRVQHIGQMQSYALFAVALLLLQRALDRGRVRDGALAGLAAGLMLMEPNQVALLGAYVLAGAVAAAWLADGPRGVRSHAVRTAPSLTAGALVGVVTLAVPLTLTMLFVASSSRSGIAFEEAALGSIHPASLLTVLLGDIFGASTRYWGPQSFEWDPSDLSLSQNMNQLYVGALPALLVLTIGVTRGVLAAREVRLYVVAALVMLVYALGRHTPMFRLLYEVAPGVSLFRRPADATFLLGALLAILAGYCVHRVAIGALPRPGPAMRGLEALIVVGMLAGAVVLAVARGELSAAALPIAKGAGAIAVAVLALALLWRASLAQRTQSAMLVVTVVVVADLFLTNGPNHATALPAARFDILRPGCHNETLALLKSLTRQPAGSARRDRVELAGLGFEWPNVALVHRIDHDLGYNPLRLGVVDQALGARDTIAGPDQRRFTALFPSYRSTLADVIGLRFIASSIPIEGLDEWIVPGDLRLIARTADAYVYENPGALPRALLVTEWARADFAQMMETGEWVADPRETVLLEQEPEPVAGDAPAQEAGVGPKRVSIRRYENTRVEIEVWSARPGFLVLNDVWHPWWRAEIDGDPAPILKANVMFRAVQVPAGRSVVRFEFEPLRGAFAEILASLARPKGVRLAQR